MTQPGRNRTVRGARAFTLLELLVVVAIVSALAAIVLNVGRALTTNADIEATNTTIQILDTAVSEWQGVAGRNLTWWQTGDPESLRPRSDVHADTPESLIINEVMDVVERASAVQPMLAQIKIDRVHVYRAGMYPTWLDSDAEKQVMDNRFDGSRTYLDAWGTPLYLIHPGRTWTERDGRRPYYFARDDDGTIRTYNEEKYGIAPNRRIVFVSAGPDKKFGLVEEFGDLSGEELQRAIGNARRDNIFSLNVTFAN